MVSFILWLIIIVGAATVDAGSMPIQIPIPGGGSIPLPKQPHVWDEVLLSLLAVAFVSWAGVVWQASRNLSTKMDAMLRQYHKDTLSNEHRLTHVEAMVAQIFNALATEDKEEIKPPVKIESEE